MGDRKRDAFDRALCVIKDEKPNPFQTLINRIKTRLVARLNRVIDFKSLYHAAEGSIGGGL